MHLLKYQSTATRALLTVIAAMLLCACAGPNFVVGEERYCRADSAIKHPSEAPAFGSVMELAPLARAAPKHGTCRQQ